MKRSGILVGGASAGRSITSKDGVEDVAVLVTLPRDRSMMYETQVPMTTISVAKERYRWVPMAMDRVSAEEIGVFVHESLMIGDIRNAVLRELIEGYRPLARVER